MKPEFTIYPAIDLRAGQVVRLTQGDPNQQTTFSSDPGAVARQWQAMGAAWLHVVNLDGAFDAQDQANQAALREILAAAPGLNIQFGGGLRSLPDLEAAFSLGVQRAILGTAAVENPALVAQALEQFGPERIGVGIDAKPDGVRTRGWLGQTGLAPVQLGQQMARLGVTTLVFTNIQRDGAGTGIDVQATQELAQATGLNVIASGGASSLADVETVKTAGLAGMIIGKAIYTGAIHLPDALRIARA